MGSASHVDRERISPSASPRLRRGRRAMGNQRAELRSRTGDRSNDSGGELVMRLIQEWTVDMTDGSFWGVEWMPDAAAFYAQRWFPDDVDEEVPADATVFDCPGPDLGLFDTLDTLELAIGGPIPPRIRGE